MRGFENFIGAWLYKGDINFIVDVGPSITAPVLIKALEDLRRGSFGLYSFNSYPY
jgi:hypothetical protein